MFGCAVKEFRCVLRAGRTRADAAGGLVSHTGSSGTLMGGSRSGCRVSAGALEHVEPGLWKWLGSSSSNEYRLLNVEVSSVPTRARRSTPPAPVNSKDFPRRGRVSSVGLMGSSECIQSRLGRETEACASGVRVRSIRIGSPTNLPGGFLAQWSSESDGVAWREIQRYF